VSLKHKKNIQNQNSQSNYICIFTVSMEKLLEEEMYKTKKLEEHTKYRNYTAQSILMLLVIRS